MSGRDGLLFSMNTRVRVAPDAMKTWTTGYAALSTRTSGFCPISRTFVGRDGVHCDWSLMKTRTGWVDDVGWKVTVGLPLPLITSEQSRKVLPVSTTSSPESERSRFRKLTPAGQPPAQIEPSSLTAAWLTSTGGRSSLELAGPVLPRTVPRLSTVPVGPGVALP